MPISPDNDKELSALLNKAEPPQSPAHLDAAILQYAREHVPTAPKQELPWSGIWLQRNWMTATATVAVATIAISVSLQFLTGPEITRKAELSRTEELALGISQPELARGVMFDRVSDSVLDGASVRAPNTVPEDVFDGAVLEADARAKAADDANRELLDAQLATTPPQASQRQSAVATAAPVAVSAPAITNLADTDNPIGATSAVSSDAIAARGSNATELPASTPVEPELTALLTSDVALQDTVIIAVRRALGVREQSVAVRRGTFLDEIKIYLETYRGLTNATILSNVQNRYSVARGELLDARLPDTIGALVAVLETLLARQ